MEISLYFHQMEKPITMSLIVRICLLFSALIFQSAYSQKEFQGGIKLGFSINDSLVKGYATEIFMSPVKQKGGKLSRSIYQKIPHCLNLQLEHTNYK